MFFSKWQCFILVNPWLFYMGKICTNYLYISWTNAFLVIFIQSCHDIMLCPGQPRFHTGQGSKFSLLFIIWNFLVNDLIQHTISLDVINLLTGPCFYRWTESLLIITGTKNVFIYLFIFICFKYHQDILYICSLDLQFYLVHLA